MAKPVQTNVRRMTEWETQAEPQLPAVRQPERNFVAPLPPPVSSTFTGMAPQQHEMQPVLPVQQVVSVATSHVDRAKCFAIVTAILATAVGVLSVVVALTLLGKPLVAAVVLSYFFTWFVLTWAVSFAIYTFTSPDFVAVMQALGILRLFGKEQDFRHERIRHHEGMPAKKGRR